MDDQLLKEFLAEAEELVEELFGDVAALRARRADGRARRELVGRLFRNVHTLKGTSSAAGLEATGGLAHEFENLLDAVRLGRVAVDDAALDAAEEAVEAFAASLGAVARGEVEGVSSSLVERLRGLASASNTGVRSFDVEAEDLLPFEIARGLGEYERARLREAVSEGARVYLVAAEFHVETFDDEFRRLSDALKESGEVVAAQPRVDADAPEVVRFRIIYASDEARARLAKRVAELGARLADEERASAFVDERIGVGDEVAGVESARRDGAIESSVEAGAIEPTAAALTTHVRVPLEALDELISSAHETFAFASDALALALASDERGDARERLEGRASEARRRFVEFEERLIGLRMIEARAVLERAARAGRAVARASGKEVEFELAGGDVRLDKSLADRVADSLLHLLRNAVAHGVETAEERRASGKPARGRVRLEALAEGCRVALRVTDDGRGIDVESISEAAAERGLVAPGERLTEQTALRLIFRPGFSTTARASSVSGRGVGLEVVERAVEDAGGEVRVRSERGRGTTFEMRLPTTLALLRALFVRSAGRKFCVDAERVVETFEARGAASSREGAASLSWRGRDVPFISLRELLGQEFDEGGARGNEAGAEKDEGGANGAPVVVVRVSGDDAGEARHAAVLVDGVEERSEVLVRGLGRHATRWRGVSGATELRDGAVALVIDLPFLIETRS